MVRASTYHHLCQNLSMTAGKRIPLHLVGYAMPHPGIRETGAEPLTVHIMRAAARWWRSGSYLYNYNYI